MKKFIILGIGGLVLVGLFAWFEIRPTLIKHDCSWVKKHEDAIPAMPAMTETELREKGILTDCELEKAKSPSAYTGLFGKYLLESCEKSNGFILEDYKETKPAKPARDWYEKSNDTEYKFCLRDKGL